MAHELAVTFINTKKIKRKTKNTKQNKTKQKVKQEKENKEYN